MTPLEQLIDISRFYGCDSRYVIAGGGNTSYKDEERLWVKASGHSLATIDEDGFAVLDRKKLNLISERSYNEDTDLREEEVKADLADACITKGLRPSVETSLHNAMSSPFVVHLHPTLVNGLTCSQLAESKTAEIFGDEVLYVPYTDPGYILFKEVDDRVKAFTAKYGKEPSVIILQNHGIFVGGETPEDIKVIYGRIMGELEKAVTKPLPAIEDITSPGEKDIIPALRMILSGDGLKTLKVTNNELVEYFLSSAEKFNSISRPFSPDIIVYCKSNYIYSGTQDIETIEKQIEEFTTQHGYPPKVILIKGLGVVAVGDNAVNAQIITDVYMDMMKIAWLAQSFGGEHPMTQEQIDFIDSWEAENYRRKLSSGSSRGRLENKTVIVTGAAQGFGEGIAKCLIKEGANIVVADLNEETGQKTVSELNRSASGCRAIFVRTNVAEIDSLDNLVAETVHYFGGIDVFVSNAGILRAGGIEDMTPENFDLVSKVNYSAYFYCVKAVAPVMKLQTRYRPGNYCDIVQVNSKSGLRGSKANFAYAGGKFGGVGLTQSFALELAPFNIKVNSICPGNFYEGPLWSDPENGLFVQYLNAGKVPGAKTVEDVREFYMAQVPMRKGTGPEDVSKAIIYVIEQTCETGQAIPVTGGQVMLN